MSLSYTLLFSFVICYSIISSTNTQGELLTTTRHDQSFVKHDQPIGVKNSTISYIPTYGTNVVRLRKKRDNTGNMDVKAIQATINDHRTMIEDNRIMIYNIMNNSINNSIQQAISNHYSTAAPMWNGWRDVALIFVTLVVIIQIIYFCVSQVQLRPCDYLVSRVRQRHNTRESQKQ